MTAADEDRPTMRLFVAMPGTNLGADAKWKNPEDVKFFFGKVRDALVERLGSDVDLIIEKEKRGGGVIHDSIPTTPTPGAASVARSGAWPSRIRPRSTTGTFS